MLLLKERRSFLIFGALFGAWLGGIYAAVTQAVNWAALPGIPLGMLSGSFSGYLWQYIIMGALLGLVSSLPENRYAGMVLGGLTAAVLSAAASLYQEWGFDSFGSKLLAILLTFLPIVVLMLPFALIVRLGVDAQRRDPNRPYLWARRYFIPLVLTLIAAGAGLFSLYPAPVRAAFRLQQQMVQQGLIAASPSALPEPLRDVDGFQASARGPYSLIYSDNTEAFFGPRPAGAELSQFLIITRFGNDFAFVCVYSSNRPQPTCTNYP